VLSERVQRASPASAASEERVQRATGPCYQSERSERGASVASEWRVTRGPPWDEVCGHACGVQYCRGRRRATRKTWVTRCGAETCKGEEHAEARQGPASRIMPHERGVAFTFCPIIHHECEKASHHHASPLRTNESPFAIHHEREEHDAIHHEREKRHVTTHEREKGFTPPDVTTHERGNTFAH